MEASASVNQAKASPGSAMATAPTSQVRRQCRMHLGPKGLDTGKVAGDRMVVEVPLDHGAQPAADRVPRVMKSTASSCVRSLAAWPAYAWQWICV